MRQSAGMAHLWKRRQRAPVPGPQIKTAPGIPLGPPTCGQVFSRPGATGIGPEAGIRRVAEPPVPGDCNFSRVAGAGLTKKKRSGVMTFLALVDCEFGVTAM